MNMTILTIIAAFGGGVFGASIGALPAFILTGVVAIIGGIADGGAVAGSYVGTVAFNTILGPHIAFAGGVAAAAYAAKIGKSENGADIATACYGYNEPSILIVGGVFGVIGAIIGNVIVPAIFGGIIPYGTDNPGMTVFISGCIARLAFGKRGLLSAPASRKALSSGKALSSLLVMAFSYALVVSGAYCVLADAVGPEVLGSYHVVIFGLAAVGLVFAEFGVAYNGWHHIGIIAAEAAMAGYAIGGVGAAMGLGIVMGLVSAILGDFEGNMLNTDVDSHIDPPAFAICLCTIVISIISAVA